MGLFLLGCGAGPPTAEVSDSLRSRVSAKAARSEALLEPGAVERFYRAREFRQAWTSNDYSQIVVAIQGISADGLTPSHYHLEAIESLGRGRSG